MDKQHRNLIEKHCDSMAPNINLTRIWNKLFEYNIFNTDDRNVPIWQEKLGSSDSAEISETVKEILLRIRKRGPLAFGNLCRILEETGHQDQSNLLLERPLAPPPLPSLPYNDDNEPRLESKSIRKPIQVLTPDPSNAEYLVQLRQEPLKIEVKKAQRFQDAAEIVPIYPMRSKPHGLVLLIVCKDYANGGKSKRNGAEHDKENLKNLFEQMGFKVICYLNLTGDQIKYKVEEFSRNPELRFVDSCFVIVSAHGERCQQRNESYIQGLDDVRVYWTDIVNCFTTDNCPNLAGKPKVFIFQACRGNLEQYSVVPGVKGKSSDPFFIEHIPSVEYGRSGFPSRKFDDILIASSTIPGYISYRDNHTGSYFVTILCKVFMQHACDQHLNDLFIMIDSCLSTLSAPGGTKQTTDVQSKGFKKLYLHPGLFEEK